MSRISELQLNALSRKYILHFFYFVIILFISCGPNTHTPLVFSEKNDVRIKKLIAQMTIDEKVAQLASSYYIHPRYSNANKRLEIPNFVAGEVLHGVMAEGATLFPQAIAMASTWDLDLIEKVGNVSAKEARVFGIHQAYAPMIAVVRDVRWGRIEESYGEDPFLVGHIGAAYIKGLQGTGSQRFDKNHIFACAKHYVADGEPMAGANGSAMDISDYNLQNIHLYPFRMAFEEGRVASIMPAHHPLNGVPCHANEYIFNDILRTQYKWNGLVVSDNQDLPRLVHLFKYFPDWSGAAYNALSIGIHQDLDMSGRNRLYGDSLINAVKDGKIPEKLLDEAVAMNLRAKFELGLFDNAEPAAEIKAIINSKAHVDLALEAAHKSIILLKNENNILPLDAAKLKNIAVIGPNADAVRSGGYSTRNPKYFITILEGIKRYVGNEVKVSYAEGAAIDVEKKSFDSKAEQDQEVTNIAGKSSTSIPESQKISQAVQLARKSDMVILAIGGSEATCRENEDVDYLGLTGRQLEMVQAVHATGIPCIVIFLGGRPISEPWISENIPAILQGWYLGQETGTAVADILFGKVNPSGKLPVTIARNVGQLPLFYNKLETGRQRRIYGSSPEPLYPFGHGLSYTSFKISNLKLENGNISTEGKTAVSVDITNTGKVSGDEVVQLYLRAMYTKQVRPRKELRGFQRVYLKPGETRNVIFEIGKKQLEYWNENWVVEAGTYYLFVAGNSADKELELNKATLIVKD